MFISKHIFVFTLSRLYYEKLWCIGLVAYLLYQVINGIAKLTISNITDNDAIVSISATYKDVKYVSLFKVKKLINESKYEIITDQSALINNSNSSIGLCPYTNIKANISIFKVSNSYIKHNNFIDNQII